MPNPNNKTVGLSLGLVIISLFIFVFSNNMVDPDLWGHLKFGQDILTKLAVPKYDFYSYSSYGAKWIDHEWLSELILYVIFRFTKGAGLIIFKYFLGSLITFIIYISMVKSTKSLYLRLLFLSLSLPIIASGFAIRPQIFTYALFAILLSLIDNFENSGNTRWIYPLPVLFLIWQDLHGGFLAGLGTIIIYTLSKIFEGKVSSKLIFIVIVSILATFINPYGLNNWLLVLDAVSRHRPYITEWTQVSFSLEYLNYFTLFLITTFGLFASKRKHSIYEIFVLVVAFYFSFRHNRHVILFAILVAFYIPKHIDSFAGKWFIQLENRFSKNILAVVFACLGLYFLSATYCRGKNILVLEIPQDSFPVQAVNFIKYNKIQGNIFSSFNWSQMCISQLSQTNRIFFDGRYETVYSDDLVRDYFEVSFGKKNYKEFLKNFPETDIILLDTKMPLSKIISKDSDWIKIYASPLAQIYLKNNQRNKSYLENFRNGKLSCPQEDLSAYFLNHL